LFSSCLGCALGCELTINDLMSFVILKKSLQEQKNKEKKIKKKKEKKKSE